MKKNSTGKCSSDIPAYPGDPKGPKQNSGETKNKRNKSSGDSSLKGMPTIHQ